MGVPLVSKRSPDRSAVDFWFDPLCPWAWLSSRWILEVETVRPVDITFHLMSLSMLNEDRDISEEYRTLLAPGRGMGRVVMAAQVGHGDSVVPGLYTELGRRIHHEKRDRDKAMVAEALAAVALPADLIEAWDDESWDAKVRDSHEAGIGLVGLDVGTPVIRVADTAFFGPVVTPAPVGEVAGKLWDGVLLVASTPGFYELKRTRDEGPRFDVGAAPLHDRAA
ncbi:MAG: disulfide bond formation protein DsbA [Sporichthya sp.]|nr:disulfide bond formation protein DsbA [Sporichthya sp.]